jgi:hypothetical protein
LTASGAEPILGAPNKKEGLMYKWIRTVRVAKGRFPQAIGWAKEMAAFGQKKFGLPEIRVYMDTMGEIGTIRWEIDYADAAAWDKAQTAVMSDPEYWQFIAKANADELFIDGSAHDYLLKRI